MKDGIQSWSVIHDLVKTSKMHFSVSKSRRDWSTLPKYIDI